METFWERRGDCRRCGRCCAGDKISPGEFADDENVREFVRIIGTDCEHLMQDSENRAVCGIYPDRPQVCRDFPAGPDDLDLIDGVCGFHFVRK